MNLPMNVMDKTKASWAAKFKNFSTQISTQVSTQATATTKTVNGTRNRKRSTPRAQSQQQKVPHKSAPKKPAYTPEPFKIKVTGGLNCYHTAALTIADFPPALKAGEDGTFKWFKLDIQTNEFTQIEGQSSTSFLPTIDHVGCRISCQWVPFDVDSAASNFAEFGPLVCDPSIQQEVDQWLENSGSAEAPLKWALSATDPGDPVSLALDQADNITITNRPNQCGVEGETSSRECKEALEGEVTVVTLTLKHRVVLTSGLRVQIDAQSTENPVLTFNCLSARDRDIIVLVIRSRIQSLRHKESNSQLDIACNDLVQVRLSVMGSGGEELNQETRKQIEAYEADIKHLKSLHVNYQKEVVLLRTRKERLQKTLEKFRKDTESDRQNIQDLNKTSSKRADEYNKLRESFDDKAKQVASLEEELRTLRVDHTQQGNNFKELKISHQALEQQLVEKCKDLRQLSTEVKKDSTRNAETQEEAEELKKQLALYRKTTRDLQSDVEETSKKYGKSCDDLRNLKEEKRSLVADNLALRSTVDEMQQIKTLDVNMKIKLDGELKETTSMLEKLSVEVEEKTRNLETSTKTIRNLETDLRFTEGKVRTYQHEVQTLRSDRDTDLEELRKKESNIEKLKRKIDKGTTKNDKLAEELETLKEHLESLVPKTKLDRILGELEITQNTVSSNHESLKKAESQVLEYRRHENVLKLEVKELKDRIGNAEESRERLVGERNYFKKQAESMRVHVEKMAKCQVAVSQPETTTLSNVEMLQREEEILSLKQKVTNLVAEKDGAEEAVKNLRRALDEHIHIGEQKRWEFQLFEANTNEDYRTLITRKDQLQKLANQLYDIIADQQEQIQHHRHTCKVLGLENIDMKKKLGLSMSVD